MDPKSVAGMLVDKVKPEPEMEEEGFEAEVDEGQMLAAEELMEALKTDDVKAFASALRSFLAMA